MDYRPKCKIQNYKTLGRYSIVEKLNDLKYAIAFLNKITKAQHERNDW